MMLLLMLIALFAQASPPPTPVRVFIHASRSSEGFIAPDQKDRDDSARDLQRSMKQVLAWNMLPLPNANRKAMTMAKTIESADVIVDVLGREASGDIRTVRAVLIMGEQRVPIEGMNDDADWSDAAKDLGHRVSRWIVNNFTRIPRRP